MRLMSSSANLSPPAIQISLAIPSGPTARCFCMHRNILVTASGDRSSVLPSCNICSSSCFSKVKAFTLSTCLPPSSAAKCSAHLARPASSSLARVPSLSFTPGTGVGLKAPSLRASLYGSRVSPRSAGAPINLQAGIQCTNWCLQPASTRWHHDSKQRRTSNH